MAWIYKLIIKTTGETYIGQTKGTIKNRLIKHKNDYNRMPDHFLYQRIKEEGGWDNVICSPVVECFEENLDELEEFFIKKVPVELTLNTQFNYRYHSEYNRRPDINWKDVVLDYNNGMTGYELAEKYNCDSTSVYYNLKKYGCETRKQVKLDKNTIYDLYVNQKISANKIGEHFGLTKTRILQLLREYNIPRRNNRDAQLVRNNKI